MLQIMIQLDAPVVADRREGFDALTGFDAS